MLRLATGCLLLLLTWSLHPNRGAAHDLSVDELVLFWDAQPGRLRGQITWNPHRTRRDDGADDSEIGRRVIALLTRSVRLEIDGQVCATHFAVRELWVPAGAMLGDSVLLTCSAAQTASQLRVFSSDTLLVSLQTGQPDGSTSTRSVEVPAGHWSPACPLSAAAGGWHVGGANQFQRDAELESAFSVARRYLELGVRHILEGGWDHIAFVMALVLGAATGWRSLVWQLSAFTLAHSITLAFGTLGWVTPPRSFVEPLIAFSICAVAGSNLLRTRAPDRLRHAVAFGFGLLHGFGFAGALVETGLPSTALLAALLAFNVGVELAQLCVVMALLLAARCWRNPESFQRYAARPISLAIALIGLYWGIQRLFN